MRIERLHQVNAVVVTEKRQLFLLGVLDGGALDRGDAQIAPF